MCMCVMKYVYVCPEVCVHVHGYVWYEYVIHACTDGLALMHNCMYIIYTQYTQYILCVVALQVHTEIQHNYEDWKLFNAVRITAEFLGKLV